VILVMGSPWNCPPKSMSSAEGRRRHRRENKNPAAERFNAGQKKMIYLDRLVLGGGPLVAATGYLMMFPFYITISPHAVAQIVHGIVALLFVAAMLGHI